MPTKDELKTQIEGLEHELEHLKTIWTPPVVPEPVEATEPMYWVYPVDDGVGVAPTAFGHTLVKDPEGDHYVASVRASLVAVEASRLGKRLLTAAEYEEYLADLEAAADELLLDDELLIDDEPED